jgi:hypothetical protein
MKRKIILQIAALALMVLLVVLGYLQLIGIKVGDCVFDVAYEGDMGVLIATLDAFLDGTVAKITFNVNDVVIQHTDKMQLMGGSDASFDIGDRLPLSKTDGIWQEMTRYLKP